VCDTIFVSGCANHYYALDGRTGDTVWDYDEGYDNTFVDWAEADSHLFTADRGGHIYSFIPDTPGDPLQCACDLKAWTFTPTPNLSDTPSPSFTATPTPSPQFSATPTSTDSPAYTPTDTPTISLTSTPTPSRTISATFTPSQSHTFSPTSTPTRTISPTFTVSDTLTVSPTSTFSQTVSPTFSATDSFTNSPTFTFTFSMSPTYSFSPSVSPTFTFTLTPATATSTFTPTATPTPLPLEDPDDDVSYAYPDPVRGGNTCKLVFHSSGPGKARARVFKANGAEAAREDTAFTGPGAHSCGLDTGPLASGVYFYTVEIEDDQGNRRHTHLSKFIVIQ
jgi:hypothetical protein